MQHQYGLLSRHLWARLLQQNLHRRMRSSHPALRSDSIFLCEVLLYIIILDWRLAIINQLNLFQYNINCSYLMMLTQQGYNRQTNITSASNSDFVLHCTTRIQYTFSESNRKMPVPLRGYVPHHIFQMHCKELQKKKNLLLAVLSFLSLERSAGESLYILLFCHIPLR